MAHILDRAVIHFFSSCGICLCSFIALHWVQRKWNWPWLPVAVQAQLVLVAVAVFAGSALREAYDVSAGQSLSKAIADYTSWALGVGSSVWGLWRFRQI